MMTFHDFWWFLCYKMHGFTVGAHQTGYKRPVRKESDPHTHAAYFIYFASTSPPGPYTSFLWSPLLFQLFAKQPTPLCTSFVSKLELSDPFQCLWRPSTPLPHIIIFFWLNKGAPLYTINTSFLSELFRDGPEDECWDNAFLWTWHLTHRHPAGFCGGKRGQDRRSRWC